MTAHTFASSFSGFGGAHLGAIAAGLCPLWGVEYDDRIATTARDNGLAVMTADIRTVEIAGMETPWMYQVSPPCPNFSAAKTGGEETEEDVALAEAVCSHVRILRPPYVVLENVRAYEGSESLRRIRAYPSTSRHAHTSAVLCAADYGVPQTRDRLILVASRVARPRLPEPTHADTAPRGRKARRAGEGLFGSLAPWNGWYAAVADLLDDLPDTSLADWQMKRLPDDLRTMLVAQGGYDGQVTTRAPHEPAFCVTANNNQTALKAVLVNTNTKDGAGVAVRGGSEPAFVVDTKIGQLRAVLVGPDANDTSGAAITREGARPAGTVRTGVNHLRRAVLVESCNAGQAWGDGCKYPHEPAPTVTASSRPSHAARVILTEPTVRTVQLSPRGLARFQSFPDSYVLPSIAGHACKGIGNAVPPDLMTAVILANL